jgi:hypothetical protein
MKYLEKKIAIMELLFKVDDTLVKQFFDEESNENLDKKIEVLTKLANGTPPADIPEYYDILEKYPKQGEMWD